jgi:hypothetical protein
MRRMLQVLAAAASVALVGGAAGPWAVVHTLSGSRTEGGLAHGGAWVLACAAAGLAGAVRRSRPVVALSGTLAAGCALIAGYRLPGELVAGGAWQADAGWGLGLILMGAAGYVAVSLTPDGKRGR